MWSERVNKAIEVAAKAHQGQVRKGTDLPYVSHPYAVAMIASKYTNDEDVIIAALCHDILEDVSFSIYSEQDMRRDFGDQVVKIVRDVSEDKNADEPDKPWLERKNRYLGHLESLSDIRSIIVSTSDKIHNIYSLVDSIKETGDSVWSRFNATKEQKLDFYARFNAIIQEKSVASETLKADLATALRTLEEIAR